MIFLLVDFFFFFKCGEGDVKEKIKISKIRIYQKPSNV